MLPLLRKELTEIAAHRRHYVLRVVWAVVLCTVFAMALGMAERRIMYSDNLLGVLGQGRDLLMGVFWAEVVAILVLMPAFTAGVLTHERETGSLPLLLLTPLGVRRLLIEKWLSRLVAVGSFLFLGLPLMAIAYAYGGFADDLLVRMALILGVICLQVSAVSLLVSAWSRTTVGAFVGVMVAVPMYYLLPWLLAWMTAWIQHALVEGEASWSYNDVLLFTWSCWNIFPAHWISGNAVWVGGRMATLGMDTSHALVLIGSILLPLVLARLVVVRRSQSTGPGIVARLFHRFDAWSEAMDARLGLRHGVSLPDDRPIAWRSRRARSMTGLRYQVRLLLGGLALTIFSALGLVMVEYGLPLGQAVLMAVAALMLVIHGASLFAGERQDQTVQVLLTTPLSARDILRQKLVGLRRIHGALLVCMLPLFGIYIWIKDPHVGMGFVLHSQWVWWAAAIDALLLPAIAAWIGILVGLHVQRRQQAVILAVVALIGWIVGGFILAMLIFEVFRIRNLPEEILPLFAPIFHPGANVAGEISMNDAHDQVMFLIHLVWHTGILLALRWWCFRIVDERLRR